MFAIYLPPPSPSPFPLSQGDAGHRQNRLLIVDKPELETVVLNSFFSNTLLNRNLFTLYIFRFKITNVIIKYYMKEAQEIKLLINQQKLWIY